MARTPTLLRVAALAALAAAGCGRADNSQDPLRQAIEAGKQQSAQRAAGDPAQQLHPGDTNPLRRKYSDQQIWALFFGASHTQGDWMAFVPCSQQLAGMAVAPANQLYLKRCPALQQYLLGRARAGGVADASVKDILDPRVSGAARGK